MVIIPVSLALRITGAVVLFMSDGLSLGYRKGRHRGTWIAKRYSAEHGRKLLELATFLATFAIFSHVYFLVVLLGTMGHQPSAESLLLSNCRYWRR